MNVLVAGGAGYVGSHAVKRLKEDGHRPVIFDNLDRGHREVIEILAVPAVVADLSDVDAVRAALKEYQIDVVMHFAAYAFVGESVEAPLSYYRNNVAVTIGLLEAMAAVGVERFVFSSTCATYGQPLHVPISEEEKKAPVSPYGWSKLMVEQILDDHQRSRPEFAFACLRYFNASGCAEDGSLGEDHDPETHLIPVVLQAALGLRPHVTIHGDDYPTPDGTAIRDYVHVEDLADAHILAMQKLTAGTKLECNLGTGRGYSVREILDTAGRVTGRVIPTVTGPRRAGDPPVLYADVSRAKALLGWRARRTEPADIIASAWLWFSRHPHGYAAPK